MGIVNLWTTIYKRMKSCCRVWQRGGSIALWNRMAYSLPRHAIPATTRDGSSREGVTAFSCLHLPLIYICWWDIPSILFCRAEQSQLSQSLLIGEMLPCFHLPSGPSLGSLQYWTQYCRCGCTSAEWVEFILWFEDLACSKAQDGLSNQLSVFCMGHLLFRLQENGWLCVAVWVLGAVWNFMIIWISLDTLKLSFQEHLYA